MSYTIETALEHKSISQAARLRSEYSVRVGNLGKDVRIRVWEMLDGTGYYFTQSHYIKTPVQAGPYRTSSQTAEDEPEVLRLAVRTLVNFHDQAVTAGHEAEDSWLVENEYF